jgi:hypothetical protein
MVQHVMRRSVRLQENNNLITIIVVTSSIILNQGTLDKRRRGLARGYSVNLVI